MVEVGRISPIHQIIEELDVNIDCDYIYEQYIKKHNPRCMFCGNNVIKVDYSIIRHLDCTYNKDWMGNCRCYFFFSGDIDYLKYHNPSSSEFYCSQDCYDKAREKE